MKWVLCFKCSPRVEEYGFNSLGDKSSTCQGNAPFSKLSACTVQIWHLLAYPNSNKLIMTLCLPLQVAVLLLQAAVRLCSKTAGLLCKEYLRVCLRLISRKPILLACRYHLQSWANLMLFCSSTRYWICPSRQHLHLLSLFCFPFPGCTCMCNHTRSPHMGIHPDLQL